MNHPDDKDKTIFATCFLQQEKIIEAFEAKWLQNDPPDIEEVLQSISSNLDKDLLLVELLQSDLEFRLKSDRGFRVENYFDRFESLKNNTSIAIQLIQNEFRLRRRITPAIAIAEYEKRFSREITGVRRALEQIVSESREFGTTAVTNSRGYGLLVTNGPLTGTRFTIPDGQSLIVGRGLASDTNMEDPHMSRIHFSITIHILQDEDTAIPIV